MLKKLSLQVALSSLAIFVVSATALSAASAEPGDGIEGEHLNLSLSATAGGKVNSNLFYQDERTAPRANALFISPGLALRTVDTSLVDFNADWGLTWLQYLSDNRALRGQSGFSTDLSASAHFNQRGAVSLLLEENLQRTNDAPIGPSVNQINRFTNRAGGLLGIHPGGRALQGYLGYHWSMHNFNFDEINFSQANRDEHALSGRFVWQFRPRTAALLNASYTFVNYDSPVRLIGGSGQLANFNSRPFRITGTLNGLVLNNLSAELTAGYARGNYQAGPSFSGVIGRAILSYYIRSNQDAKLSAGFIRSFQDTPIGNFVLSNRIQASYTQAFADKRLALDLGTFVDFREYAFPDTAPLPVVGGSVVLPDTLSDVRIGANAGLSYSIRKWLSVGTNYTLLSNTSDQNVAIATGTPELAGRNYVQHIIAASVTARY